MNIYQVVVTLSYGDGVGNDVLAIDTMLKEEGYHTHIYAEHVDSRIPPKIVSVIKKMPQFEKTDVVIYHFAIGCDLNMQWEQWGCRIILRYHNVTPPDFFKPYDPRSYDLCRTGLQQIKGLAQKPDYCICVSEFNASDLRSYGYECPMDIVPILIPFEDYKTKPSESVLQTYQDGWTNLIFVGRVSPNKKQEDVLKIFTHYKKHINPFSRLIFVGSYQDSDRYYQKIKEYERLLEVEDVVWTGHLKFDEIIAFYHIADIFLCMSEHEGFCIPLVEAMYFQVPIVAYSCSAIPDTMKYAGGLVHKKDPVFVSEVIDSILKKGWFRNNLINLQNEILSSYYYNKVKDDFLNSLEGHLELTRLIDEKERILYDMTEAHKRLQQGYCTGIERVSYELYQSMKKKANVIPVRCQVEDEQIVYYPLHPINFTDYKEKITFTENDTLFRPELNDNLASLQEIKETGCRVYVIVHDLLPLQFPQFFDEVVPQNFKFFLNWLFAYGDGCICVSNSVAEELRAYVKQMKLALPSTFTIDASHNGISSFDQKSTVVLEDVQLFFEQNSPIFFMLGTIEPRKNHKMVLEAFEKLWARGCDYRFCIIGRIGWKMDEFIKLVQNHKELGRKLMFWEGASDDVVAYTCTHASALIQASFGEGFGLPLIEASCYNLPILCSDIPVFHEVAGEFALYFDPYDSESLCQTITHFLQEKSKGNVLSSNKISISTWDEAAERVLKIILN